MKLKKKLFAVILMLVFAIGAGAGAVYSNMTMEPVQDNAPVVVQGDSADLSQVDIIEVEDEPETQVCPDVPVCPVAEPETVPQFREISYDQFQDIDFTVFGPEYSKFPSVIPERDSPSDVIKEFQIHVYPNKVTIDVNQPILASFADTNSMDPVLDARHNAIEIVPRRESDVQVGDIVSYKTDYGSIIHRIKEIGHDEDGWYAIFQGDNNPVPDPGRIRFEQLQRKVVAIIY
jgi:hypothetical protein